MIYNKNVTVVDDMFGKKVGQNMVEVRRKFLCGCNMRLSLGKAGLGLKDD